MMAVSGRSVALAAAVVGVALSHGATSARAAIMIDSAPNPNTAGDPVVIYGSAPAGARVVLWHRINPAPRFTRVSHTRASAAGRYESGAPTGS